MARLKLTMTMSLDGYVAGPDQSLENPLGVGGAGLHDWAFATRSFRTATAWATAARPGLDDGYAAKWNENIGATIMGRNMFGPVRGAVGRRGRGQAGGATIRRSTPVFVLTHHARDPVAMAGGTTFHFVTEGIEAALERAFEAAGGRHVSVGGGAEAAQQYLRARPDRRARDPCRSDVPRRRLPPLRGCRRWAGGVRVHRPRELDRRRPLHLRPARRRVGAARPGSVRSSDRGGSK